MTYNTDDLLEEIVSLKVEVSRLTAQVGYLEATLADLKVIVRSLVDQQNSRVSRWTQVLVPMFVTSAVLLIVELIKAWGAR